MSVSVSSSEVFSLAGPASLKANDYINCTFKVEAFIIHVGTALSFLNAFICFVAGRIYLQ